MKILLLSDIHGRVDWFRFAESFSADLTAIAGDLLDGFSKEGFLPQALALARWAKQFPSQLAICSGNHDANTPNRAIDPDSLQFLDTTAREETLSLLTTEYWMDLLETPRIVTDRRSRLLETAGGPIVITTLPFNEAENPRTMTTLWRDGQKLRRDTRAPWLVLHHEPPAQSSGRDKIMLGCTNFTECLQEFQPDFALSGHLHIDPYLSFFVKKIGKTLCFNPGHPPPDVARHAAKPNQILLNLECAEATWFATSTEGSEFLEKKISLADYL
jgi:Icc-related predicted phosphoesterase